MYRTSEAEIIPRVVELARDDVAAMLEVVREFWSRPHIRPDLDDELWRAITQAGQSERVAARAYELVLAGTRVRLRAFVNILEALPNERLVALALALLEAPTPDGYLTATLLRMQECARGALWDLLTARDDQLRARPAWLAVGALVLETTRFDQPTEVIERMIDHWCTGMAARPDVPLWALALHIQSLQPRQAHMRITHLAREVDRFRDDATRAYVVTVHAESLLRRGGIPDLREHLARHPDVWSRERWSFVDHPIARLVLELSPGLTDREIDDAFSGRAPVHARHVAPIRCVLNQWSYVAVVVPHLRLIGELLAAGPWVDRATSRRLTAAYRQLPRWKTQGWLLHSWKLLLRRFAS